MSDGEKIITKLYKEHIVIESPTCGEIREILTAEDYPSLNIAIAEDIKPTKAHYHQRFEEIYFVLDGLIRLKLYDPDNNLVRVEDLNTSELCVIGKGVHHRIIESSEKNRLCAISVPRYDSSDMHLSDEI